MQMLRNDKLYVKIYIYLINAILYGATYSCLPQLKKC